MVGLLNTQIHSQDAGPQEMRPLYDLLGAGKAWHTLCHLYVRQANYTTSQQHASS